MTNLLLLLFLSQTPEMTFVDQGIASANEKIAKEPKHPDGYNDLAMMLARKERETGDPSYLKKAEDAVAKSLTLEPANFEGRKARVAIRLREKRYEDALEEAQALNKKTPDDNQMYGFISEAENALGNYSESEKAVQRMLDLRSVNGPGFERGAILREIIGYPDAAIDWWNQALQLSSDRDTEERAYIHTQMARVFREQGKYDAAALHAQQAITLCPNYPAGMVELAMVRLDRNQPKDAVDLLQARLKIGLDLESLYWLGRAWELAGEKPQASTAYANFEKQARTAVDSPGNANALLIRYLADHGNPAGGLAIAAKASRKRNDLFSLRSTAWALLQNGQPKEALDQIRKALAPGMRDASLYFDAGMIARSANDAPAAATYFRTAFEINSNSPYSADVLKQLAVFQQTGSI